MWRAHRYIIWVWIKNWMKVNYHTSSQKQYCQRYRNVYLVFINLLCFGRKIIQKSKMAHDPWQPHYKLDILCHVPPYNKNMWHDHKGTFYRYPLSLSTLQIMHGLSPVLVVLVLVFRQLCSLLVLILVCSVASLLSEWLKSNANPREVKLSRVLTALRPTCHTAATTAACDYLLKWIWKKWMPTRQRNRIRHQIREEEWNKCSGSDKL